MKPSPDERLVFSFQRKLILIHSYYFVCGIKLSPKISEICVHVGVSIEGSLLVPDPSRTCTFLG